jgi:Protein of unknown function (DUF2380)
VEPLTTLIALALASTVTAVHAAEPKVAVFDFEFVDTSVEGATNGPRSDEGARLAWLDREMRQRLAQSGRTDESWSRALDWLVDRYLLAPGAGVF